MGINVNKVSLIVFAISGITAGIAGTFMGMKYTVYPNLGDIANKAFIASVIGGMGSLPGAVLGAFVLGVIETMVCVYIFGNARPVLIWHYDYRAGFFAERHPWQKSSRQAVRRAQT